METNNRIYPAQRDTKKNYQSSKPNEQLFQSFKMTMDEDQLEISLRINLMFGNHFKVECEDQMVTVNLVADPVRPRMTTKTILLPCAVDQKSMTTKRIGDLLTIRFKRSSVHNYLFNWNTSAPSGKLD
jgi:hypothetical protein